jgi:putative glycosyltransferase (TIGR04372 family)
MFGKPSLLTNWMPWGIMPWGGRDLIIPKLLRDRISGRILTAEESLSEPIGFIQDDRHMKIHNIEALENNEQDLIKGTEEMLSEIQLHKEDKYSLGRYQAMFQKAERHIGICNSNGRLCETFGAKHPELWGCSSKRQK